MQTKLISFGLMIALALIGFFTGSTSNVGDAVKKAFDKEGAIKTCAELINETPMSEINAAVDGE